ncbi:S8 family serine peptidase [Allokutzneria sp. A3M-2-11 16]|uniref:S8 family peptidase n=1 Tax=Allokutzneria sp. A3M-2-11 16 TaxID=2962043 RepID=UPI0020B74334|nr:S8 family serine peptidase [Allokutzneria sp. A3M-2-11 16]MCP3804168.1 S8 family serine peptidase [Allokutzneria sp. A3M-2-11 16]
MRARWVPLTVLVALTASLVVAPSAVAQEAAPKERTVTLLTGDRVVVRGADVVGVRPGPDRDDMAFHSLILDGKRHVYPADALPLVRENRLDDTLFNVTELISQGFDDESSPVLPVLMTRQPQRARAVPNAGTVTRDLPGLGITAVAQPRARAGEFWASLNGPSLRAPQAKVWLNRRLQPSLDQSAGVIGAPEVWRAGGTGAGVPVAVLDTGYDRKHPDLAGRVTASKSFLAQEPVDDTNGHGTHVASTIAGSGPRFRGIAHEAKLLVGKVCGNTGCPEDAILEGMQWVADQGARVVNMSLGGPPTDGTDPLSQAVNTLSAKSGTLFVIASGNSGRDEAVESPGSADAALTVAASSKSDVLAPFSSRGPRTGDHAAKPDIAAPGVDIVAARAAGTLPQYAVSESYARLSGTSMATPHVAGAVAVLAQRHPDWKGEQLKAAIMGAATPLNGASVFGQGVGRLDLARSFQQQVRVEPASLSMGGGAEPVHKKVRYTNDSDKPVTLKLDLPAQGGLFTVDSKELVVPAKGSAEVTVTADFRKGAGLAGVRLTATAPGVSLRTSVVAEVGRKTHILTVKAFSHKGTPDPSVSLLLQDLDTGKTRFLRSASEGVAEGRYRVLGQVIDVEFPPGYPYGVFTDRVKFAQEITVTRDAEVVLDGRDAKPVDVRVDDPEAVQTPLQLGHEVGVLSQLPGKGLTGITMLSKPGKEFVVPSKPMAGLSLYSNTSWNRRVLSAVFGDVEMEPADINPLGFRGDLSAKVVDVGKGTPEELAKVDVRGALALFAPGRLPTVEIAKRVSAMYAAGAAGVLGENAFATYDPAWTGPTLSVPENKTTLLREAMQAGPVTVRVRGIANPPAAYVLHDRVAGALPNGVAWHHSARDLAKVRTKVHYPGTGQVRTAAEGVVNVAGVWFASKIPLRAPAELDMFFTPDLPWLTVSALGVDADGQPYGIQETAPTVFTKGRSYGLDMFKAPFNPELSRDGVTRDGNKLRVELPMFTQSGAQSPIGAFSPPHDKGTTTLTVGGKKIGGSDVPGIATVDVPAQRLPFELRVDATRTMPGVEVGTGSSAVWKFHSGHTGRSVPVALPDVRYDLDPERAKPGEFTFRVSGGKAITVQISTDDGKTWAPVPVLPSGEVKVVNPAKGFVSLRTTALGADGASVTETLIRAYRVS